MGEADSCIKRFDISPLCGDGENAHDLAGLIDADVLGIWKMLSAWAQGRATLLNNFPLVNHPT